MPQSVSVLNAKPGREFAAQFPHSLVWKTCLREIAILDSRQLRPSDLREGDEVRCDEEAYRFLLEVICGLHSPLLGETEVLGQFKSFAQRAAEGPAARCTVPWIQRLIADAKRVRTNHLIGLGSRSYGQLTHVHLAGCERIFVLGAGHLAHEILPWFSDRKVDVFCRRPQVAGDLRERHEHAVIRALSDVPEPDGLPTGVVVAAPMTADEVRSWLDGAGRRFEVVVDLRGESPRDPLDVRAGRVVHFQEVLEDLETNGRFAGARVERARQEIRARAQEFWDRCEVRPFGWEDLCA